MVGIQDTELTSLYDRSLHSENISRSIPSHGTPDVHPRKAPFALRNICTICLLPVLSLSYLVFCFVVDHKTTQVSVWNIDDPVARINVIKAGVTSINILIISLAIFPLKSLVGDLQAEEFFRVLTLKGNGVPLLILNQISLPSNGFFNQLRTVVRGEGSSVFAGAFTAALMAIVVSILAPATLSVQIVQMDDELHAFRVGAVFHGSVWNSTDEGVNTARGIRNRAQYAAGLPWVENNLMATYKWELPSDAKDGSIYAIPTPLDVPVSRPVRYVTDLIRIKPACKWHAPDLRNVTGSRSELFEREYALIPELGWSVTVSDFQLRMDIDEVTFDLDDVSPDSIHIRDAEGSTLTDGSAIWHLNKCIPGSTGQCRSELGWQPTLGNLVMTDIPTTTFVSSSNITSAISYLVCSPNESVETKEITTDQDGKMSFGSSSRMMTRQYNINIQQARILMSHSLLGLDNIGQYSGPNPHTSLGMGVGGAVHLQLLFGKEVAAKAPDDLQFVVRPIQEITQNYGKILQSSLKLFLDGTIGYGYVPGRTLKNVVIFTISRPHLYASTIVFVILSAFMVATQFRSPVPRFTFIDIASSLSRSDVPGILEDINSNNGLDSLADEELYDSRIVLEGQPGVFPTTICFHDS